MLIGKAYIQKKDENFVVNALFKHRISNYVNSAEVNAASLLNLKVGKYVDKFSLVPMDFRNNRNTSRSFMNREHPFCSLMLKSHRK